MKISYYCIIYEPQNTAVHTVSKTVQELFEEVSSMKYNKPILEINKFDLKEDIAADGLSTAGNLPGFVDEDNSGNTDNPDFEVLGNVLNDILTF